ncbi:MAG: hypothetical protein R3B54_11735 [Bdellovibrionota bacterium]
MNWFLKLALLASLIMVTAPVMADDSEWNDEPAMEEGVDTAAPAAEAPAAKPKARAKTAKAGKKVSHKVAKKECLKENPKLKGKALKECIKGKRAS